jgi:hypothetical protein
MPKGLEPVEKIDYYILLYMISNKPKQNDMHQLLYPAHGYQIH